MSDKLITNKDVYISPPNLFTSRTHYKQILKYNGKHRFDLRNCTDCKHMVAYVNWWCINKDASDYRSTSLPGESDCSFWEPCDREAPPVLIQTKSLFKKIKQSIFGK